jgi:hypothetical protein
MRPAASLLWLDGNEVNTLDVDSHCIGEESHDLSFVLCFHFLLLINSLG